MKATRTAFVIGGVLFLASGAFCLYQALATSGELEWMWWPLALTGLAVGLIFVVVGRYAATIGPGAVENGLPAQGRVLAVADTGVTMHSTNLVVKVTVLVELAGVEPYEATTRIALGRTQWGAIQPGMVLPLEVDRDDRSKVALDDTRPVRSALLAAGPGQAPQVVTRSAADILAAGVATTGVLRSVVPVGITAGQVAHGLAPEQADDPVVQISMDDTGPGGAVMSCTIMVRVPDGTAGFLAPGATIPVSYLPAEPSIATIDFGRL